MSKPTVLDKEHFIRDNKSKQCFWQSYMFIFNKKDSTLSHQSLKCGNKPKANIIDDLAPFIDLNKQLDKEVAMHVNQFHTY